MSRPDLDPWKVNLLAKAKGAGQRYQERGIHLFRFFSSCLHFLPWTPRLLRRERWRGVGKRWERKGMIIRFLWSSRPLRHSPPPSSIGKASSLLPNSRPHLPLPPPPPSLPPTPPNPPPPSLPLPSTYSSKLQTSGSINTVDTRVRHTESILYVLPKVRCKAAGIFKQRNNTMPHSLPPSPFPPPQKKKRPTRNLPGAICGSKGPKDMPNKLLVPCASPTPKLRSSSSSTELLHTILAL